MSSTGMSGPSHSPRRQVWQDISSLWWK